MAHTSQAELKAEAFRLRAELRLIQNSLYRTKAESDFWTAIDIAREQAARAFELRATTSLARLLDAQGRRDEARAMLAEI
jgi:hypothetical protein